jgi:hypothetical protein
LSGILGALAAAGAALGSGGTPTTPEWTGIFGVDAAYTNNVTMAGYTGSILVSASRTGSGLLYYVLNGVTSAYSAPLTVPVGATLGWGINVPGLSSVSGAVTVTDDTNSTTLATIAYTVKHIS